LSYHSNSLISSLTMTTVNNAETIPSKSAPYNRMERPFIAVHTVYNILENQTAIRVYIHVYPKRGPRTIDVRFSERHGRWSSPDISIRVACAVTVARLLRPRSSDERVNWFTEKTISALAYRILSTPRLTRNIGASAGQHTEQWFKFIVPTVF